MIERRVPLSAVLFADGTSAPTLDRSGSMSKSIRRHALKTLVGAVFAALSATTLSQSASPAGGTSSFPTKVFRA